jgi:hypothetical protein
MWHDGAFLVVRKGEAFPNRCVKSNRPGDGRRVRQAVERSGEVGFLLHLWSPLVGALIDRRLRKCVTLEVGLSDQWRRKRRRAFFVAGTIILVSLAAMAYGVTLMGRNLLGVGLTSFGLLFTLGGLLYGLNASTLLTAKRITANYVWLNGVHPDYLAELPEWPGELMADILGSSDTSRWQ